MRTLAIAFVSIIISTLTLQSQAAEFEGQVRLKDGQFRLYKDNVLRCQFSASDSQVSLLANSGDLRLSAIDKLILTTGNDELSLSGSNIKIGTEEGRTDFKFLHGSGSSTEFGFTLFNKGGNGNQWTLYTKNGDGHLTFSRNEAVVGTFAADGVYMSSDRKLKKNINPLKEVLPGILALTPSKYDYIKSSKTYKKTIGFIAQDVNKYFPELVLDEPMDDGEVVMQLNYAGFGVLAIKAIQEQQTEIKELKQRVEKLEKLLIKQ